MKTQQIHAAIQFTLPEDPLEMASTLSTVAAAWRVFSDAIRTAGLSLDEQTFAMGARPARRQRRRSAKQSLEVVHG